MCLTMGSLFRWIALAAALALAGCSGTGLLVGAGATAGVAVAEDRELDEIVSDTDIKLGINRRWLAEDPAILSHVSSTVTEGRVLLTGTVPDPGMRLAALRAVWQVQGVRQVINEIAVQDSDGLPGFTRDVWISTQLRSRMTFDTSVLAINYSVETVDGVIYLMGIAQDQGELDRVIAHAREIGYVRGVVPYVRIKTASTA